MAKKVTGYIKLQIPAGKATPAPPVGPALGQHGVNIVQFTKEFNARTADQDGMIIPVVITVYADRSFSFITKTPPAAVLLKKAANIKSGSGVPNKTKVAKVTKAQVEEIAQLKMKDLNAASLEAAEKLAADGIDAKVINIHTIKPLDEDLIVTAAKETGKVVTVEEHSVIGGLGGAVCECLSEKAPVPVKRIGVNDRFGESGPAVALLEKYGLDGEGIYKQVKEFV